MNPDEIRDALGGLSDRTFPAPDGLVEAVIPALGERRRPPMQGKTIRRLKYAAAMAVVAGGALLVRRSRSS